MNRSLLVISAIVVTAVAMFPDRAASQQKTLKDQLLGTWTLVSFEVLRPDGSKTLPWGDAPKGISSFDANGRYYHMLARSDLPKIAAQDRRKATPQEVMTLYFGMLSNYGTYTVNEADKTITIILEASSNPNQVGVDQKRIVTSVTADELRYHNNAPTSGGGGQNRQVYRRVK
jgi:Lipocalin-like domain